MSPVVIHVMCFVHIIQGEAGATSKTEQRGGGDTEAAGKTEGDRTESSAEVQRLAAEEEPRKNRKRKEGQSNADLLQLFLLVMERF